MVDIRLGGSSYSATRRRGVMPSARVLRVLAILGLDGRLTIHPSLPDALAAKPAPNA